MTSMNTIERFQLLSDHERRAQAALNIAIELFKQCPNYDTQNALFEASKCWLRKHQAKQQCMIEAKLKCQRAFRRE